MLKMSVKQLLAVLLFVLLIVPSPFMAASPAIGPRTVLGSVTSRGTVRVGETLMPSHGTLFSGDEVQTNVGSALIQYQQGARVQLGTESSAHFTSSHVQLQRGQMAFRTLSGNDLSFAASTLRLEPAMTPTVGYVTLQDQKVIVSVKEGILNVLDPTGVQLDSLKAGEARFFLKASAALAAPAAARQSEEELRRRMEEERRRREAGEPPLAPPQEPPGNKTAWVIGGAVAAAAAGATIVILTREKDETSIMSPATR